MDKNVIALKNINKDYKDKKNYVYALTDVTLKIEKGSFVAIMGESGAGKTTLLNVVGLIDKPTNGEYYLLGQNVSEQDEEENARLRNKVFGYVLQEYGLIDHYTVYENIEIPLLYTEVKTSETEKEQRARAVLRQLGIEDKLHVKAKNLSGGQRQRVSIARALINNPQIIIADEPTAALDKENAIGIMKLLKQINEEEKITIVMVSHDDKVAEYADRIIRLQDGRIFPMP